MTNTVTIQFAIRREEIVPCGIVTLYVHLGSFQAEYVSGSEVHNDNGTWSYTFVIQSEDLPEGVEIEDIESCNLVAPYVDCDQSPPGTCSMALVNCFANLPVVTWLSDESKVGLIIPYEECELQCLAMGDPEDFYEEPPASTPLMTPTPSEPPTPPATPTDIPTPPPQTTPPPTPVETPPPTVPHTGTPVFTPPPTGSIIDPTPPATSEQPTPVGTPAGTPIPSTLFPDPTPPATVPGSGPSTPAGSP